MSFKVAVHTVSSEPNSIIEVVSIATPAITSKEMLIKTIAVAANPTDWKHPTWGRSKKGDISGTDAAGVVEEVGAEVTGFVKGDIVSSFLHGNCSPRKGCHGEYAVVDPATSINYNKNTFNTEPLSVGNHKSGPINTFEAAASVTLGLATVGLSFGHNLKLDYNQENNADRAILIWGGATATGSLAIQVAKKIYGLTVISTASPTNHDLLKSYGADHVVNYRDADVVDQIKNIGNGKILYALDTVGAPETYQSTYDATEGAPHVDIDNLLFLGPPTVKQGRTAEFHATCAYNANGETLNLGPVTFPATPELLDDFNHFWKVLNQNIGVLNSPNLKVLEPGLESVNEALELLKHGKVSAEKVVLRVRN